MSTAPDALPLGPGPIPADGPALLHRLWEAGTAPGAPWAGLDPAALAAARQVFDQTTVVVDGADLTRVVIDATGLDLPETLLTLDPPQIGESAGRDDAADAPQELATGAIGRLEARAHPVRIAGAAIHLDAELNDQPVRWLSAAGETLLEVVEPSAAQPVAGYLRATVSREEAIDAARRLITHALAAEGLELVSLEAELTGTDGRSVHLDATAKIRKGLLSASARVRGTAALREDLVLQFTDVAVTSRNVVVAAVLAVVRRRIEEATREPIALGEMLPAGVRLSEATVRIGREVEISARFS